MAWRGRAARPHVLEGGAEGKECADGPVSSARSPPRGAPEPPTRATLCEAEPSLEKTSSGSLKAAGGVRARAGAGADAEGGKPDLHGRRRWVASRRDFFGREGSDAAADDGKAHNLFQILASAEGSLDGRRCVGSRCTALALQRAEVSQQVIPMFGDASTDKLQLASSTASMMATWTARSASPSSRGGAASGSSTAAAKRSPTSHRSPTRRRGVERAGEAEGEGEGDGEVRGRHDGARRTSVAARRTWVVAPRGTTADTRRRRARPEVDRRTSQVARRARRSAAATEDTVGGDAIDARDRRARRACRSRARCGRRAPIRGAAARDLRSRRPRQDAAPPTQRGRRRLIQAAATSTSALPSMQKAKRACTTPRCCAGASVRAASPPPRG